MRKMSLGEVESFEHTMPGFVDMVQIQPASSIVRLKLDDFEDEPGLLIDCISYANSRGIGVLVDANLQ
jgi:hypothetical protein